MKTDKQINIAITGDFCPIGEIENICLAGDYENLFGGVRSILQTSDISITNLECPLTRQMSPIPKMGPNLAAHPACIDLLKHAGINVVTLANNHIMDHGVSGLDSTVAVCVSANIQMVGTGSTLTEAEKPLYINVENQTVAIINCAESEFSIASDHHAGANPLNPIKLFYAMRLAKEVTDVVLVIVHGGNECYQLPSPRVVDTYRFIADLGASAVIGHHTHCASGYEWHNGVPILYSLGNFLFAARGIHSEDWHKGIVAELRLENGRVDALSIHPFNQCQKEPGIELMQGDERIEFLAGLDNTNQIIADRDNLEKNWKEFIEENELAYFSSLLSMGRIGRNLLKRGLYFGKRTSRQRLLRLLNLVQCEAHRDVTLALLQKWVNK